MELSTTRREYRQQGIDPSGLQASPFEQFKRWFAEAEEHLDDPTAMVLATANLRGEPSQRIVLLKNFTEESLVFFTNSGSQKASDLQANPSASLLFPWHRLDRQIIIGGSVSTLNREASEDYFQSRPKASQLSAWASPQSQPVISREWLEAQVEHYRVKFGQGRIPLPEFWGGYQLHPQRFEFWQGRENRLHDRFEYCKNGDRNWVIKRLAP